MNKGNASSQVSGIHSGPVCSSPNSTSPDPVVHNLSDISISTVEYGSIVKGDATIKDSIRFVSLPGAEESSHTIIQEAHKPSGKFAQIYYRKYVMKYI